MTIHRLHSILAFFFSAAALVPASVSARDFDSNSRAGIRGAVRGQNEFIKALTKGEHALIGRIVSTAIVNESLAILRDAGEVELAAQLGREWDQQYKSYLERSAMVEPIFGYEGLQDVGDHSPLFAWLERLHDYLSIRTNGLTKQMRILEDINTLNYALPVLFSPRGKWRTGDFEEDRIEYRKHLIPVANMGVYWASLVACRKLTNGKSNALQAICSPAAAFVEWQMGRHIAPKVADFIYRKANSKRNRILSLDEGLGSLAASAVTEEQLYGVLNAEIE